MEGAATGEGGETGRTEPPLAQIEPRERESEGTRGERESERDEVERGTGLGSFFWLAYIIGTCR